MRFRKKAIVIEAIQASTALNQANYFPGGLPDWVVTAYKNGVISFAEQGDLEYVLINTLEGTMKAESTDWIIQGVKGELYPIKNEIFIETYDPVDVAKF